MAEALSPAKISYACSAYFYEHYDAINLTADQWTFLQTVPDGPFRQSVRDFMVGQQFRRDYSAKGAAQLTPLQRVEGLRAVWVVSISYRPKIEMKIKAPLGEVSLHVPVYGPILDYLSDCRVRTIGEIEAAMRGHNINLGQVVEAVMVLTCANHLTPANDENTTASVQTCAARLNDKLIDLARSSGDLGFVASPVTGGGISVTRLMQNFLLGVRNGFKTPPELANFAWRLLDSQEIIRDAKPLETAEANIAELIPQAAGFLQESLPILKALKIE